MRRWAGAGVSATHAAHRSNRRSGTEEPTHRLLLGGDEVVNPGSGASGSAVLDGAAGLWARIGFRLGSFATVDDPEQLTRSGPGVVGGEADLLRSGRGAPLAVGFGAQTVTSGIVKRSLASRRAVAAGEIFLQAVREGRTADAQGMCGPEAREQVATLSACAARSECRGARAGDEPGTWFVQIVPGASGGCTARLVLASGPGAQQGKPFERWLVTACEIEGVGITPSGT